MHVLPKPILSAFLFATIAIHATALTNSSSSSQLAQTSSSTSSVVNATLGSSNLTFQSSNYAIANLTNISSSSHHATIMTTQMNAGTTTATFHVWPKDGTDQSGNKAILGQITEVAGLSLDKIVVSQLGSDLSSVNFFTANMTREAADRIANATEVRYFRWKFVEIVWEMDVFLIAP